MLCIASGFVVFEEGDLINAAPCAMGNCRQRGGFDLCCKAEGVITVRVNNPTTNQ